MMTNLSTFRKNADCPSVAKDDCCKECYNSRDCASKCKMQTIKSQSADPVFSPQLLNTTGIQRLPVGVITGIIAALVGGFLMSLITGLTGDFYFFFLAVAGAIGGFGFGAFTEGNNFARGIIGCIFAVMAMIIGYYFIYTTPVQIYGTSIAPSSIMTFSEFFSLWLEPLDYIFMLVGIVAGYFGGTGKFAFK